jgi:phosphoglycerate dehydrogenase-like enzyme
MLFPPLWESEPDRFAEHVAAIEALDPTLRVVVTPYEEPRELRVRRADLDPEEARALAPALTDEQRRTLAVAEIVVTQDLPSDVGAVAPQLRWVQAIGSGTEHLQSAGLGRSGIRLTSNAGGSAGAIAEFVIARVLQDRKRLRDLDELQRSRAWDRRFGQSLAGCTVGLIGLGGHQLGGGGAPGPVRRAHPGLSPVRPGRRPRPERGRRVSPG